MILVALWLCAACVVMFFAQMAYGTEPFLLINELKWAEPWRMITSIFAHADVMHLFSNLLALGFFGSLLEHRIGSKKLFLLFMASGIIISVLSIYDRSLGASGAVYAVLACLALLRPGMIIYFYFIPMPMVVVLVIWFLQDVFGLFNPSNVANLSHIFGLVMGVAAGFYWNKQYGDKPKPREDRGLSEIEERELNQKLDEWEDQYMKPRN